MSTKTYVLRDTQGNITDTRSSTSSKQNYTHAVVFKDGQFKGKALSMHNSAALAQKAAFDSKKVHGGPMEVLPVEVHEGAKATVLKRLAKPAEEVKPQSTPEAKKTAKATAIKKRAAKANETKTSTAKKAPARKAAPQWTKGEKVAGGYTVKWVHGYYCLAQKPVEKTIRRYEWIAILSDGHKITADKDGAKLGNAKAAEVLVREYRKTMA